MKKILYIFLILWSVMIVLPISIGLLGKSSKIDTGSEEKEAIHPQKIKYLDAESGKASQMDLEEYLIGVLAAEMPAEYHIEALKAQAVAARSFILKRLGQKEKVHEGVDICSDPNHCKGFFDEKTAKSHWPKEKRNKYWEKLKSAVDATRGEYMVSEDEVVEAFFFARSGGRTENSEDVWGEARPYLKSVESEEDLKYPEFVSKVEIENSEARKMLRLSGPFSKSALNLGKISYTDGGNVKTIEIEGRTYKGTEVRKIFGLKSSDFDVLAGDKKIVFSVRGYGHGVGMSQFGAGEMAKNGKKYTEILSHYYTNIQIVKN